MEHDRPATANGRLVRWRCRRLRTLVLTRCRGRGLGAAGPAAAETVIGFDTAPAVVGQSVNTAYAGTPGLVFAPSGVPPTQSGLATRSCGTFVRAWPYAASGANAVQLTCGGSNEFDGRVRRLYAAFTAATYQSLSIDVGAAQPGHRMRLVAFDGAGQVLAQTAATAIPVDAMTTLSVTAGVPEIAAFMLTDVDNSTSGDIYVDDLTLQDPPFVGPKTFTLAVQGVPDLTAVQGESPGPKAELVLYRVNGSAGQVTYSVQGLPPNVTWSAAPSVNGATLRFTAFPGAAPTRDPVPVTVTATPVDAGTATQPRTIALTLQVVPAIAVSRDGAGDLVAPSCQAIPVSYRVYPHAGPARWTVGGLPPGVTATIDGADPASVPVIADGKLHGASLVLKATSPPGGATPVTIGITGRTPYTGLLNERVVAGAINGTLSPTSGRPPESLTPGTEVTITGRGLCAPPGSVMRFGNDAALAPITASPDGRTLTARVPALATTGPVGIVPDPGNPGSRVDGPGFTVNGFRDTWGMPFSNYTPKLTFKNMEDAFGKRATHISANPCGIVGKTCRIITPFPDPWAVVVWGIAQASIGGAIGGKGGACYGISRTVAQIRSGILKASGFPPGNAATPSGLAATNGPSGKLAEHINAQQLGVLSSEALSWYAAHAIRNRVANNPLSLRLEIERELRAGRFPAISLRNGGTAFELHVVLAYDVTQPGADPNQFDVWTYDSNVEFMANERDPDGATHRSRTEGSRLRVNADGSWSLPSSNYSAGRNSLGNIVVFPDPTRPARPSLPTAPDVASDTFVYLTRMGSTTAGEVSVASAREGWDLTGISSGGRPLLDADGEAGVATAGGPQAVPWAPATGAGDGARGAIIVGDPGSAGFRFTATGRGAAGTQTIIGPGIVAQVAGAAPAGAADELEFDPREGALTFTPASAGRPTETRVMVRASDGATLSAGLEGSTGRDGTTLGVDPRSGEVTVDAGAGGSMTVRLGTMGRGPSPVAVTTRVRVAAGERLSLPGSAWRRLASGRVAFTATGPRGTRRGTLAVRRLTAARAAVSGVRILRGRRPTALVTVRAPRSAAVQVTLGVRAGGRLVATTTFPAVSPGTARRLRWRTPALAGRGRRLVVLATAVDTRSGVPAASVTSVTR
ncbi:MAG: hypothetical protein U0237_14840 [Thermoleophilia bacterium]